MATGAILLRWRDRNWTEEGHYIYRSDSPMDVNALPNPIDSVDKNTHEYIDYDVVDGNTYYYRIGAFRNNEIKISDEIEMIADPMPYITLIENILDRSTTGMWYEISEENVFKDESGTIPVQNDGDPVRCIKDQSNFGYDLIIPSNAPNAVFKHEYGVKYVEFTGSSYGYFDFDTQLQYPFFISMSKDGTIDESSGQYNTISIANPSNTDNVYSVFGHRSQFNGPGVGVYDGTWSHDGFASTGTYTSVIARFEESGQWITEDNMGTTSTIMTRGQPSGVTHFGYNRLLRSGQGKYDGARLYSFLLANTTLSDEEQTLLYEYHKTFLPS